MLLTARATEPARRALVLLVEDHDDTRQMYAEFLQGPYEVVDVADAPTALERARARRPDILVTDLSLPGMDGFELIAELRADPGLAAVPIVCLSGYDGHAHEARARAAGSDRILQKPCMPDTLVEVISDLLRRLGLRSLEP